MRYKALNKRLSNYPLFLFVLLASLSCITPITFDLPSENIQLVVEGRITNEEPPYTVRVSQSFDLSSDTLITTPEEQALVVLYDNQGNSEVLDEIDPGVYQTRGFIQGTVGRSYYIYIKTEGGAEFESEPEELRPVGEIKSIRHEYDERSRLEEFGLVRSDVFNIFLDADGGPLDAPLIRWRLKATYEVVSFPELHEVWFPPFEPLRSPWPCSGYIIDEGPIFSGGTLRQVGECTCCKCWAIDYEDIPQLSDQFNVVNNNYQNILVGEVPITNNTFHRKVLVEVEQMSVSEVAFNFYRAIRSQKLGASDLFQPQIGQLQGNIRSLDPDNQVLGLFYAGAVDSEFTYLYREDVPYNITPITVRTLPCAEAFPNAVTEKPDRWIN